MKKNIGRKDRIIRLVISLLLFALAAYIKSLVVFAFAVFVLFESLFSWCVFYQILGKSSCPVDPKK